MVQVMESWFLADTGTLKMFYGQGFRKRSLPANPNIENIPKNDVDNGLAGATRGTVKGGYNKGAHGFKILANLDPERVRKASRYADRFIAALSG